MAKTGEGSTLRLTERVLKPALTDSFLPTEIQTGLKPRPRLQIAKVTGNFSLPSSSCCRWESLKPVKNGSFGGKQQPCRSARMTGIWEGVCINFMHAKAFIDVADDCQQMTSAPACAT